MFVGNEFLSIYDLVNVFCLLGSWLPIRGYICKEKDSVNSVSIFSSKQSLEVG